MSSSIKSRQRRVRKLFLSKDGLGTPTLSGLSSEEATITDNGVGDYTINFNRSFALTDFICTITSRTADRTFYLGTKAKGSVQVLCKSLETSEEQASVTFDSAIKFHSALKGADGNDITIQFADAVTAGSEAVASVSDAGAIVINIEGGVSTATQVHAALMDSDSDLAEEARNFIQSEVLVGATAISTAGATNLAGGVDQSDTAAAEGNFDIEITGSDIEDRYYDSDD